MTEDGALKRLLQSALPPVIDAPPQRDVWRLVVNPRPVRSDSRPIDLCLAGLIALVLSVFPRLIWVLVYHL